MGSMTITMGRYTPSYPHLFLCLCLSASVQTFFFRPPRPPQTTREIKEKCSSYRNSGDLFLPAWCNRAVRGGALDLPDIQVGTDSMPGSAPAITTGWGWSLWSEWGGSCPGVCPGRGRFCNGVCSNGKGTALSDSPELEMAGNGDTGA